MTPDRRRSRPRDVTALARSIELVTQDLTGAATDQITEIVEGFERVLGPELVTGVTLRSVVDGTVTIESSDALRHAELRYQHDAILARLQGEFGSQTVRQVRVIRGRERPEDRRSVW